MQGRTSGTMRSGIPGINRTSLWNAWKQIRQEMRHSRIRDVVDHFDYDLDPEVWIRRLIRDLASGAYEPRAPRRFTLAKGKGFSRRMTLPSVPDLVLYRAIASDCYRRAKRREHEHVYFERSGLSKAQQEAHLAGRDVTLSPYTGFRRRRFLTWLRYDQYRKYLIFEKVYPFIVVSDVTNFFDSIQYQRIGDALAGIASAKMLGLLFFLLERLSIREAYTGSPLVGLPVDEFECSRALAHLVLFPHDTRIVERVGERAYVRWMDDQNVGAHSRAEAWQVLALVGESVSRLHLTANTAKSRILSLAEARRHYHLDLNRKLDRLEAAPTATQADRRRLGKDLRLFWKSASQHEGTGEWDKILKRTYRLAALSGGRWLRARARRDVGQYPGMIDRIADYVRVTGTAEEYLTFAETVWNDPEQIYPDVNLALFERLLLVKGVGAAGVRIRRLAVDVLRRRVSWPGADWCHGVAPLVVLRFGDRRSAPVLRTYVRDHIDGVPHSAVRACAVVYASYGRAHYTAMRAVAGRMLKGELSECIRMLDQLVGYDAVPQRFNVQLQPIWDAMTRTDVVQMRRLLIARLLRLNRKPGVREWLSKGVATVLARPALDEFDRRLIRRLVTS